MNTTLTAETAEKADKMNTNTYVYAFRDGDGKNKQLLGGKGANLCEMTQIGLNVPPGFVITTEACLKYWPHRTESCRTDSWRKCASR